MRSKPRQKVTAQPQSPQNPRRKTEKVQSNRHIRRLQVVLPDRQRRAGDRKQNPNQKKPQKCPPIRFSERCSGRRNLDRRWC